MVAERGVCAESGDCIGEIHMIEIYATVGGVLQCTFPRVLSADSCDKLAILLFRLQALRKVLYGIRKQRSEILFPSLLRRPKEPYPCLNPNRERLEHYLSAVLCVKRIHSLWLSTTQACTQMLQYSPRSTPQLRPIYTATMACYLPPSMVICPIQRRRQHEKGNKTAK